MTYIKVKWIHSHHDEPVLLYSELDGARCEQRKVEMFSDGHCDYASSTETAGSTRLGEAPIPLLTESASDPQFQPVEITKQEFEEVWARRKLMSYSMRPPTMLLIIGYGNPLRGDDGIGPAVIDELQRLPIAARAELLSRHQLGPELAEQLAAADAVIFIDASALGTPGEIRTRKLQAPEIATSDLTHHVSPELLLATARELYGRVPNAALVTVCGETFAMGAPMSEVACKALHKVVSLLDSLAEDLSHG